MIDFTSWEKVKWYSAEVWDSMMRFAGRQHPRRGMNCRVDYTAEGVIISADGKDLWFHPWSMRFNFEQIQKKVFEWKAYVLPGFVNGQEATISRVSDDGTVVDVPLMDDQPAGLTMSWRNVIASSGVSASDEGDIIYGEGEGYPQFFDDKGVKSKAPGGTNPDAPEDPLRTRELRACDVFLVVPRIATRSDVTLLNIGTDAQSISIATIFLNDYFRSATSRYKLQSTPKWNAPQEPSALDRLLGTAVEPQTDEIKIATVWAMSPPNAASDASPDQTWEIFAQYFVYWNLMHASFAQPPTQPDDPLVLPVGFLAGGVADAIIRGLLDPANDAFAKIDAFLRAANYKGGFWTV